MRCAALQPSPPQNYLTYPPLMPPKHISERKETQDLKAWAGSCLSFPSFFRPPYSPCPASGGWWWEEGVLICLSGPKSVVMMVCEQM